MTKHCTNHSEGDARVARGGLYYGLAFFEFSGFSSIINYRECEPILNRRHGIKRFHFDIQIDMLGGEAINLDNRSLTDSLKDVFVFHDFSPLVVIQEGAPGREEYRHCWCTGSIGEDFTQYLFGLRIFKFILKLEGLA